MRDDFYRLTSADPADPRLPEDLSDGKFFGFPAGPALEAEERLKNGEHRSVAYFSMEFGLAPSVYNTFESKLPINAVNTIKKHEIFSNLKDMDYYHSFHFEELLDLPIYSGGLGVLAGDVLKSCADLRLSVAGLGILWGKGYFKQNFWFKYGQVPEELKWDPTTYPGLIPLDRTVDVRLNDWDIKVKLWKYYVYSYDRQHAIPLVLLDTDTDSNPEDVRKLTDQLYRADNPMIKIAQRALLGIAGVKALKELGYNIDMYHLNEGHAALAYVELTNTFPSKEEASGHMAYTCHTPVEAGHDRFNSGDLEKFIGQEAMKRVRGTAAIEGNQVNLTKLAMDTASFVNAVAQKHGEITRIQFPSFAQKIKSITNGVHHMTWVSEPIAAVLDKHGNEIGDWRKEPERLKKVSEMFGNQPFLYDLWNAHQKNKKHLCRLLKRWLFDENVFTICWARRIAPYKRPSLILHDIERMLETARTVGPLQIILAGKAHPADNMGSTHIREMLNRIDMLTDHRDEIKVVFLENYDTYIAKFLTSSVDVWLNNPLPPFEASGTSGMKAIFNGVPQLTTLDGWVVEAKDWGIGRIFGYAPPPGHLGSEHDYRLDSDSDELQKNLEEMAALYYRTIYESDYFYRSDFLKMMVNSIAAAGYFNTHRMVKEYNEGAWRLTI